MNTCPLLKISLTAVVSLLSVATFNAYALQSQLGAPAVIKSHTLPKPIEDALKAPPIRVPGKVNVDLAIYNYGERAANVYYVSVKNIGTTASAETNVYCAANATKPDGGSYALERVYMMKPLAPNAAYVTTCDFRESKGAFNSSQGALKPGEKIFDVHFIVNNQKQIVETNYDNNDVRAKPGVAQNLVKTGKD